MRLIYHSFSYPGSNCRVGSQDQLNIFGSERTIFGRCIGKADKNIFYAFYE